MSANWTIPSMTTPLELFRWSNDLSSGILVSGFLFVLWIIIAYKVNSPKTSDRFLASSFIVSLIATLLMATGLLDGMMLTIFWIIFVVSILYSKWSGD